MNPMPLYLGEVTELLADNKRVQVGLYFPAKRLYNREYRQWNPSGDKNIKWWKIEIDISSIAISDVEVSTPKGRNGFKTLKVDRDSLIGVATYKGSQYHRYSSRVQAIDKYL
ncbi:MAG: hypothetical protein DHS20C13_27360 [Thermodesulfobacteriota bacterium]|nr:MAG: hypothetical protein DHS20C13_27360 [Thermodesulfobacteriota bacterium]